MTLNFEAEKILKSVISFATITINLGNLMSQMFFLFLHSLVKRSEKLFYLYSM